jgi:hypothetical protein
MPGTGTSDFESVIAENSVLHDAPDNAFREG